MNLAFKRSVTLALLILTFSYGVLARYPAHWWKKVEENSEIPSWEILPSSGELNETLILSKRNELGILSNFAATPIEFDSKSYASLEGAWQSMKYPESEDDKRYGNDKLPYRRSDVEKMAGFEAKRAGSLASKLMKKHKINFVTYKNKRLTYRTTKKGEHYKLIKKMMKAKLDQNLEVQRILKSTGKLILLPDHHSSKSLIPPAWKYYDIWMELRESL